MAESPSSLQAFTKGPAESLRPLLTCDKGPTEFTSPLQACLTGLTNGPQPFTEASSGTLPHGKVFSILKLSTKSTSGLLIFVSKGWMCETVCGVCNATVCITPHSEFSIFSFPSPPYIISSSPLLPLGKMMIGVTSLSSEIISTSESADDADDWISMMSASSKDAWIIGLSPVGRIGKTSMSSNIGLSKSTDD